MDTITKCRKLTWAVFALAILALFAVTPAFAQTATVTTDRADYSPGDTAIISGSGWFFGETVAITIDGDPLGQISLQATADFYGAFSAQYLVDADDVGLTFTVTAGRPDFRSYSDDDVYGP